MALLLSSITVVSLWIKTTFSKPTKMFKQGYNPPSDWLALGTGLYKLVRRSLLDKDLFQKTTATNTYVSVRFNN